MVNDDSLLIKEFPEIKKCRFYRRYVKALDALDTKTRAVFVLHRHEGFPYSQIARRCNISIAMVEMHMMIALKTIKDAMLGGNGAPGQPSQIVHLKKNVTLKKVPETDLPDISAGEAGSG